MRARAAAAVHSSPDNNDDADAAAVTRLIDAPWSTRRLFIVAFLARALLIFYARVHDYMFDVRYTDVDYAVFTDAAAHAASGGSPYARATYRYSPLIALLNIPNSVWPDFGKWLFCCADLLTALLIHAYNSRVAVETSAVDAAAAPRVDVKRHSSSRAIKALCVFWLFNPLIAIISTRGNADCLICACVAATLYLLQASIWPLAALVHGALAIHLKIYPIIYLPSIYLHLARIHEAQTTRAAIARCARNTRGIAFCVIAIACFVANVAACYRAYGERFLDEYLLYHIRRKDVRHNFSIYFYPLYIASDNVTLTSVLGFGAFVPQLACIAYFALRYSDDLPFCWFLTTASFVALNKVCTSQYFVWYLMFLPLIADRVEMCASRVAALVALWFGGQALWLLPAYLLEFRGWRAMEAIWLASLAFLAANMYILRSICRGYAPPLPSGRVASARVAAAAATTRAAAATIRGDERLKHA